MGMSYQISAANALPSGETRADQVFAATAAQRAPVLLLQGPVGPFFADLHQQLIALGHDVLRICFHAADTPRNPAHRHLRFAGDLADWRAHLHRLLGQGGFGIVILFGADRPLHRIARDVAHDYPVQVLCLEEGYIRPGFITVEEGGNNGASPIAGQLPDRILPLKDLPAPAAAPKAQWWMYFYAARYYLWRGLMARMAERALFHRQTPLLRETLCWLRNPVRRWMTRRHSRRLIAQLAQEWRGRFYLVALQVTGDANLIQHGQGWTNAYLIDHAIASFARSAPPATRLVFKVHPMDRGHSDPSAAIRRRAAQCGVAGRVDILLSGTMGQVLRHAAGLITINSTSGLSAIFHGVPLLALGRAIYSHPALARVDGDMDAFWRDAPVASPGLRAQYLGFLRRQCLQPGDFYHPAGRAIAVRAILTRLCNRPVQTAITLRRAS
jgi:capsular polysaccharide export protein